MLSKLSELSLYRCGNRNGVFSMRTCGDLVMLACNDRCRSILEYGDAGAEPVNGRAFIHPDDFSAVRAALKRPGAGGATGWVMRVITGTGAVKYALVSGCVRSTRRGGVFSGTLTDITDQKRAQEELAALAETDSATGLLNRRGALCAMERYFRCEDGGGTHALFMIDLDDFKHINDALGHQRGDDALIFTASAIRRVFRQTDILGRIGGDEFLLLMKNAASIEAVRRKAQELVEALRTELCSGEERVKLTASVGVALTSAKECPELTALYSQADAALYESKRAGRDRYTITQ